MRQRTYGCLEISLKKAELQEKLCECWSTYNV